MPTSHHSGKTNQRLYLLVGLALSLGSVVVLTSVLQLAGWLGPGVAHPSWTRLAAFVGLVAVAELVRVHVRVRSTRHGITWADAVILVGLVMLPAPWVVLATAAGIAVGKAVQRRRPIQVVFGAAKESVTAFAGGLVLAAWGAGHTAATTEVAPFIVAFLAMTVVDAVLAFPVIAAASRTRVRDRLLHNWDIQLFTLLGRFGVAVAAITALALQPQFLYVLPLLILILHLWHERWVRTREERKAWQHLTGATESFTGVELDAVLRAAVTSGARLFSADEIEVEIWLDDQRRLVRGDANAISFDGDPIQAPAQPSSVYAVALQGYQGERDIGALRLRFRHEIKISEREQAMLQTYAAALDTAVRNAAAYGRLGEATAAHAHAAAHDPLTGLANRRELERHLAAAVGAVDGPPALLLIDVKHFKEVNDALGHLAGDQVLIAVARRLTGAADAQDVVCRFGGDEFAVLLPTPGSAEEVAARARRLLASLTDPVEVEGVPLSIEVYAGLALLDPADERPDGTELMRRADVAMHQSKRTGQSLFCYDGVRDPRDRERLELSGQLARAVAEGEFELHFQPIVDLATGAVVAAEALARWRHPIRGLLSPQAFLGLLERSSHLPAFTESILHEALAAADLWRDAGHDLAVSVNISARSLLDTNLPGQVLAALEAHRTPPANLCLELTETRAISQLETADRTLRQLRDLGVRMALDDFGTGYSPLAALPRVPAHQLKIDRSFVRTMHADMFPDVSADAEAMNLARAVVRYTIDLGRDLGLTVVAEGIETEVQRHSLWELGCLLGQGHLFARPTPARALLALLARGAAGQPGTLAPPLHSDGTVVRLSPGRPVGEPRQRRRS